MVYTQLMDDTVDPTLSFFDAEDGALVLADLGLTLNTALSGWTGDGPSTTYEAVYDVVDTNLLEPGIQVGVTGGQDVNGNVVDGLYEAQPEFSIDTVPTSTG